MQDVIFTPSDFVAVLNQTLEYAYPSVAVVGEIANFRVSRGRWVYFDIKDDSASVKCFGTVYALPGPLEEGMVVQVNAQPRLSPQYGFSLNFQAITPVGEGSLKRAADLLLAKLDKEGLFDPARKRSLPYPPAHIGLIASKESAAYVDFNKVLNARWGGMKLTHVDVQVQGEQAVGDIVRALELLNQHGEPPEVIVITRGGGSADDLAAFSTEQVTRAVAASRIPTLVAIGHEVDISLAELAADQRASTPSNAAELLVPDKQAVRAQLAESKQQLHRAVSVLFDRQSAYVQTAKQQLRRSLEHSYEIARQQVKQYRTIIEVLDPETILKRGYALVRDASGVVRSIKQLHAGQRLTLQLRDGRAQVEVKEVQ